MAAKATRADWIYNGVIGQRKLSWLDCDSWPSGGAVQPCRAKRGADHLEFQAAGMAYKHCKIRKLTAAKKNRWTLSAV